MGNNEALLRRMIRATFCGLIFLMWSCKEDASGKESERKDFQKSERVIIGAERLLDSEFFSLIDGKRVGLLTNHTGILPNGTHLIDLLNDHPNVKLTLLFGPEHGLRGEDDTHVSDGVDTKTGLPIISLYGELRKPTPEMLEKVDVLIFDIQDVGARFYTYIKTMLWMQEAAAETNIPFVVLDRPNPIGGIYVDGPVAPIAENGDIPITHGMTVGELAQLFNSYRKDEQLTPAKLSVVPMLNYKRSYWYDDTGLPWIKPSPNMLSLTTAAVYPATCLIEGSNISAGRGTGHPFEQLGAPWIDGNSLAEKLNSYHLKGVQFEAAQFVPDSLVDGLKIYPPKFLLETCHGITINITDRETFESAKAGIYIFHALMTLFPEDFEFKNKRFDGLLGTATVREQLQAGKSPDSITNLWQPDIEAFKENRKKHLLY